MTTAHLLRLLPFLSLLLLSAADDAAVMSKLLTTLTRHPSDWSSSTPFCKWSNVKCDSAAVVSINLNSAGLAGSLPPELNQLSNLQTLALQQNSLSGILPSFSNMTSLKSIYLDNNDFTSVPNDFLLGLTGLETLSISENIHISPWQFPSYLTDSTNLVSFYASHAGLTGKIPNFFRSFPNLQTLRLSYNNLTGSLPESFAGSEIKTLWLNNQGLSGGIDVLSGMTQLSQVWLHANSFSGGIPDLSNCTSLFDLQLRDNHFTGVLPPSLMNLPQLLNISLQNNRLQGPFPVFASTVKVTLGELNNFCLTKPGPCDPQVSTLLEIARSFGYPMSMADTWIGNNVCRGWRFISCSSPDGNVTVVNMPKQGLVGSISPAFGNLTSLRNLVLNDNNLSGVIPSVLTTLPQLQIFDVSNNNLSGPLPVFRPGVKFTYSGNVQLDKNGKKGGRDSPNSGSSKGSSSVGVIVGVVVAVVLFIGVMVFVSYKCYAKRRQHERLGRVEMVKPFVKNGYGGAPSDIRSQSIQVFEGGNATFSIQDLRQVTNNFSEENVLGRGGFGVVYKGELHDGTKIAVKRMIDGGMGTAGMNEFQAEITVLSKVRHRHLVALLGYCINGNERLLVYEHMPQGTLAQHLFEYQELGYQPLTWKQRLTIALDVARGVEYLHSLAQTSFIHRDLKPSNILLSDNMRAKVADFGLVKDAPDGKNSMATRLAGTFGYLAPEYAVTGKVTRKIDVYAFGVILMEILTGRKALDETMPAERLQLVTWFRRILITKDNLQKSIDPTLNLDDETYASICTVAELAGHCTAREPNQRPDMGHAVNVLVPLVEEWKPSKPEEEEGNGIDLHMTLPQVFQRWQDEEGTSRMLNFSYSGTRSSVASTPMGFGDTFGSRDCR